MLSPLGILLGGATARYRLQVVQPLQRDDVLALDDYLAVRGEMRERVRRARAQRRITIGDRLSVTFENRETVLYQVQEMCRVEGITDEDKIAEEIAVYNDLIAAPGELRATFFVEVTDRARIKDDLDSLVGLETSGLFLEIGTQRIAAEFEPGHAREDRISAVHYVRFVLTPDQQRSLAGDAAPVAVLVDHPKYSARAELSTVTRRALAQDLGVPAAAT